MPPGAWSPYAEGRKAWANGTSITDNPYKLESNAGAAWQWGYLQANADDLGDPKHIPRNAVHAEAEAAKARYCNR
jgi:hypothetical protein